MKIVSIAATAPDRGPGTLYALDDSGRCWAQRPGSLKWPAKWEPVEMPIAYDDPEPPPDRVDDGKWWKLDGNTLSVWIGIDTDSDIGIYLGGPPGPERPIKGTVTAGQAAEIGEHLIAVANRVRAGIP